MQSLYSFCCCCTSNWLLLTLCVNDAFSNMFNCAVFILFTASHDAADALDAFEELFVLTLTEGLAALSVDFAVRLGLIRRRFLGGSCTDTVDMVSCDELCESLLFVSVNNGSGSGHSGIGCAFPLCVAVLDALSINGLTA